MVVLSLGSAGVSGPFLAHYSEDGPCLISEALAADMDGSKRSALVEFKPCTCSSLVTAAASTVPTQQIRTLDLLFFVSTIPGDFLFDLSTRSDRFHTQKLLTVITQNPDSINSSYHLPSTHSLTQFHLAGTTGCQPIVFARTQKNIVNLHSTSRKPLKNKPTQDRSLLPLQSGKVRHLKSAQAEVVKKGIRQCRLEARSARETTTLKRFVISYL